MERSADALIGGTEAGIWAFYLTFILGKLTESRTVQRSSRYVGTAVDRRKWSGGGLIPCGIPAHGDLAVSQRKASRHSAFFSCRNLPAAADTPGNGYSLTAEQMDAATRGTGEGRA